MASKFSIFVAAALAGAGYVSAQAAPNWQYVPTACASACSVTVQVAYLCESQFSSSTDIYGCYCNSLPSDASGCASCLNSNNAAALGQLVSGTVTACPQAKQACFFECSFNTCANSDIPCQCSASYLANIYNCASCNSANGNTQATTLQNFQALNNSCGNQGYSGVTQSFTTVPIASASTNGYQAPTLTAAGGGVAATGGTALSVGVAPTTISGAQTGAATTATGGAIPTTAGAASGAGGASAGSGTASGAQTGASAAATTKSGAEGLVAPAFGGILAAVGAVVALL